MIDYRYNSTEEEVAQDLTEAILAVYDQCIRYPLCVGISGGSTPLSLFNYWSNHPNKIIERDIHLFWVDERMVPHNSSDSNFGNACRTLFDKITFPQERLHPIATDQGSVDDCAHMYDTEMLDFMKEHDRIEPLDIVILGMGEDGHTSSLFPGQDLFDKEPYYIPSIHPHNGVERVALSYKAIMAVPNVFFHITGEKKEQMLTKVIDLAHTGEEEAKALPTSFVIEQVGDVTIFTNIPPRV